MFEYWEDVYQKSTWDKSFRYFVSYAVNLFDYMAILFSDRRPAIHRSKDTRCNCPTRFRWVKNGDKSGGCISPVQVILPSFWVFQQVEHTERCFPRLDGLEVFGRSRPKPFVSCTA